MTAAAQTVEADLLARAAQVVGEALTPFPRDVGQERLVAHSSTRVVYLAGDPAAAPDLDLEARRLVWARAAGVPVPIVEHVGEGIVVATRVPDDPQRGAAFGHALVASLTALASAPPPPAELLAGGRARTDGGPDRIGRVRRALTGGVDVVGYLRARRTVASLPLEVACHGDAHDGNLLYDAAADVVRLADWEMLHVGPRGSDLAVAWANLGCPVARGVVREALHAEVGAAQVAAVLMGWAAHVHLLDLVTCPDPDGQPPELVGGARDRVAEAGRLASATTRRPRAVRRPLLESPRATTPTLESPRATCGTGVLQTPDPGTDVLQQQPTRFRVVVDPRGRWLSGAADVWQALELDALEPNPFYGPAMLAPALAGLEPRSHIDVICVLGSTGNGREVLTGVFPLARRATLDRLPARLASLWNHSQCALTTPLLSAPHAAPTLHAFLEWFDASPAHPELLRFRRTYSDGPFAAVLDEVLCERDARTWAFDAYERALFVPAASGPAYLEAARGKKARSDLRRRLRRLGELGATALTVADGDTDVDAWLDEFLTLEDSGWKGGRGSGTSLRSAGEAPFFRDAVAALHHEGRARLAALRVDGAALAMYVCVLDPTGTRGWALKTAYDEAFAAYGPGTLMFTEESAALHGTPIVSVDSCATPGHPLIDKAWSGRVGIRDIVVARGDIAGRCALATVRQARPALAAAKAKARAGLDRLMRQDKEM